jgi:hypothetical protein
MSAPISKIVWADGGTTRVPIDSPAREVAAELAKLNIHILVRLGDADEGTLKDIAILDEKFAADVLRMLKLVVNKQE